MSLNLSPALLSYFDNGIFTDSDGERTSIYCYLSQPDSASGDSRQATSDSPICQTATAPIRTPQQKLVWARV